MSFKDINENSGAVNFKQFTSVTGVKSFCQAENAIPY
jgi:hypothetical protein